LETEISKELEVFNTFEECLPALEKLLLKNKHKWQLKIVGFMEWDDIAQIIRIHIMRKWHLYNKSQNFSPWANTIINNQLKNIRRNVYDSCSRPCLKCVYNMGGDGCDWTVDNKQDSSCPLFKKWENSKKYAHDIKLPVSTENHINEVMEMPSQSMDSERYIVIFHQEMKKKLKPSLWMAYEALYIKNLTEDELASKLGFISNEKNRKPGYARLQQIKRLILRTAREVKDKIDFI
jgi:hypothetical protein